MTRKELKDWFESLNSYQACGLGATIIFIGQLIINWVHS